MSQPPNQKPPPDKRDRINVDLLGMRSRIQALQNHPQFRYFRQLKFSGMIRHLIDKGLEYYEAQTAGVPEADPPISALVQGLSLPSDSLVSEWEVQAIASGIRPSDEQLVYLATILIKPGSGYWSTHELMAIRDRDFPVDEPKTPNGRKKGQKNGTH